MNISDEAVSEAWEVTYGYIGAEVEVVECESEEIAEAVALELQTTHFAGSTNWTINARRMVDGE